MLQNKVAVVTGASRGIGRAIALALAVAGADIAVIATKSGDAAEQTVRMIEETGRKSSFYSLDVSKTDDCQQTVNKIAEDFGAIDILVNNAGITRDGLLMQMKEEDFDRVIEVNLKGAFNMTKACIRPFIRKKSGNIINISSVAGLMGNAGQTNYAASKAGLIGFTKSVAREYAARGIVCNAVCPGYIDTDMTDVMPEDAKAKILAMIPQGVPGKPEDVAAAVLFLASSSYITGETLRVDGGMYI